MGREGFSCGLLVVASAWVGSVALAQDVGTVLREQKIASGWGNFTGVLDNDDHFGSALAAPGDVDGDGVGDLAVGAPDDDDGGTSRGAVWILFLDRDGTVEGQSKISDFLGGFLGALDNLDRFGVSVAAVGDLDDDGIGELAVGAEQDDDGGTNRGAVWILFLDRMGEVRAERKISQTAGGFSGALRNDDRFGRSVAGLGDLDGDGVPDLVVGAHQDDDGGSNRGAAWVLFLNADGTVKGQTKISARQGGFAGTLRDFDNFGVSLARLGDLDGDEVTELAVGAHQDDDGGSASGAAWILFLTTSGLVKGQAKIGGASGIGLAAGDHFGVSVAGPGDIDGDDVMDLAVGAIWDDDGGLNRGAVSILFLQEDGGVKGWQKISSTEGNLVGPLSNSEFFGAALAALWDADGDRKLDLAAGADGDDAGGGNRGATWVLFLETFVPAAVVVRNGSGINRMLLTAEDAPATGSIWEVQVDCHDKKGGVVFHVGVDTPTTGPIHRKFGEWLVDWSRPRIFQALMPHHGTIVTIPYPVPADPALVGLPFYSQALVTGRKGPELTNALDGEVAQGAGDSSPLHAGRGHGAHGAKWPAGSKKGPKHR